MIGKSYPGQEYLGQDYPTYGLAARSCSLAVTEAQDIAAMAVAVGVSASLAVTEAQDIPALVENVRVSGSLAVTEAQDVVALAVGVRVSGSMDVTEAQDISAFVAAVRVNSSIAVTEEQDIPAFDVHVIPLDITEIPIIHRGPRWITPPPSIPAEIRAMIPGLVAQLASVVDNQSILRRRAAIPEIPEIYDIELSMKNPDNMTQKEYEKWRRQNPRT